LKDLDTINLALVHGEAARSERIPESGIDLLVVGDINRDKLLALITNFEETTGITVNLTGMTRSDFDYRNARGDTLVRKIWGEKKMVVKGRQ
jgi:predicted nucleotidyltransferase